MGHVEDAKHVAEMMQQPEDHAGHSHSPDLNAYCEQQSAPEIPWAGPPLPSDEDVITILRESGSHSFMHADRIGTRHLAKCNMVPAVRMAYAKGLGEAHHNEEVIRLAYCKGLDEGRVRADAYDALVERLMANIGEDWEASEGSAESILVNYVHALEQRVKALGGHTKAHDGGVHAARGEFIKAAEKHVTTDGTDEWNVMVDAWNEYVRVKAAAE